MIGLVLVETSVVALFTSGWVKDTVSTTWKTTIGSTSGVDDDVVVQRTIITLFGSIQKPVTAQELAVAVASTSGSRIIEITLFTGIREAITADWQSAVGLALVSSIGVEGSVVALLSSIDDSITTSWVESVSAASVGFDVGVPVPIIAFLSWLNQAVVVRTSAVLGNVEIELRKEGRSLFSSVEQHRNTNKAAIRSGVQQLGFQISVVSVDGVLRG